MTEMVFSLSAGYSITRGRFLASSRSAATIAGCFAYSSWRKAVVTRAKSPSSAAIERASGGKFPPMASRGFSASDIGRPMLRVRIDQRGRLVGALIGIFL